MSRTTLPALAASLLLAVACGSGELEEASPADPCRVHLHPGDDDQLMVQSALVTASAGSMICFDEGVYHLTDGLSLSVPGITLRATEGLAILDFSAQVADAPGLDLKGDDLTVEGLEIRNSAGDAIRLQQVDSAHLQGIRIGWGDDAPPVAGARGVAILESSNVLVEEVRIHGAEDAGLAVIDSMGVVIRRSSVARCGDGIVEERSADVDLQLNRIRVEPRPHRDEPLLAPALAPIDD